MKIFSRALLAFILAATTEPLAKADVTLVSGTVYDVGKYTFSQDSTVSISDGAMCWAAAASNVIQYWQDAYMEQHIDSGRTAPNGSKASLSLYPVGTGYSAIYDYLLQEWTLGSGVSYNAISWWMQGRTVDGKSAGFKYYPSSSNLVHSTSDSYGGFYTNIFGSKDTATTHKMPTYPSLENAPFYSAQIDESGTQELTPKYENVTSALKRAFETDGQAVVLNVYMEGASSGHAITCWGYEADAEGNIQSLILSDSDDRMFGTFIVSLGELSIGENESQRSVATISTNRYNSWYHGDVDNPSHGTYTIRDVIFIDTPDTDLSGNQVATTGSTQTDIRNLTGTINYSGNLSTAADCSSAVTISYGQEANGAARATVLTTSENASISIHDTSSTLNQAQLVVGNGAMALLNGGLAVSGANANNTGGVEVLGHLYAHGGTVSVTDCSAVHSGAGMYAGVLDNYYGFYKTDGLYATSFIEIKNVTAANISRNHSDLTQFDQPDDNYNHCIGGGGIAAEDSFAIISCGTVEIDGNSVEGHDICGGGALAIAEASISNNQSVRFADNSISGSGNLSEGGGLAAMFTCLNSNEKIEFSKNTVSTHNSSEWYYVSEADQMTTGAHANGGAIALTYTQALLSGSNYISPTLDINGNAQVSFAENAVDATYTYDYSENAYARGGAISVGNLFLANRSKTERTIASISNNTGDISFDKNTATALSTSQYGDANGVAQGGAIYVAEVSTLSIDNNEALVSFTNNSTNGSQLSQGGAIYNAGNLSIKGNGQVTFSDNTAMEGSHIFNETNATAEIAWNKHVSFSSTGDKGTVVNKGNMYLAAEKGKTIDFVNTRLDSTQGTVVLGTDSSMQTKGSGTVHFTDNTRKMDVGTAEGTTATLEYVYMELGEIVGTGKNTSRIDNLLITADVSVSVGQLTMGAGNSISVGSSNVTLTDVVIDLSGLNYSKQSMGEDGGTCYVYDLSNMINCALTMNNVQFMVDGTEELSGYTATKDAIAFYFGDDVNILNAQSVTLAISGSSAPQYLDSKSGAVYFGENVTPPDIDVPEPATGILALVGLAGLAGRRRRK